MQALSDWCSKIGKEAIQFLEAYLDLTAEQDDIAEFIWTTFLPVPHHTFEFPDAEVCNLVLTLTNGLLAKYTRRNMELSRQSL